MENLTNETIIKSLIDKRIEAIRNKDAATASRHYAPNVLLFDLVGPLQHTEPNAVKNRLSEWMATFKDKVGYDIAQLNIKADTEIAFCHSLQHVNATLLNGNQLNMWWRETLTWQKINGRWLITHAHSSVPFDVKTGGASIGLYPAGLL